MSIHPKSGHPDRVDSPGYSPPGPKPLTYADGLRRAAEISHKQWSTGKHSSWNEACLAVAAAIEAEIAHRKPGSET